MRFKQFILMFLLIAPNMICFADAKEFYPFTHSNDAERFTLLTQQIRCVVCQNQNIADSNAPLAKDLREKVYRMVLANKTNQDIEDFLTNRYGEFILLKPRFNKLTSLLWLFPLLSLVFILMFFIRINKKSTKSISYSA